MGDNLITTQEMYRHETFTDLDGKEQSRWPSLGFHPYTQKLEPFRQFLREAAEGRQP